MIGKTAAAVLIAAIALGTAVFGRENSEEKEAEQMAETAAEIAITSIDQVRIGQVENAEAGTGCTVFVCEDGMRAGVDIRGGGPASRETPLLNPLMSAQTVHAIVLAGGSAFGLDAAGGVMRCLEERDIGYDVGVTKVSGRQFRRGLRSHRRKDCRHGILYENGNRQQCRADRRSENRRGCSSECSWRCVRLEDRGADRGNADCR